MIKKFRQAGKLMEILKFATQDRKVLRGFAVTWCAVIVTEPSPRLFSSVSICLRMYAKIEVLKQQL